MSTRANIIIRCGRNTVYIYRHSDGYPACLGVDLYEKVSAARGPKPDAWYSEERIFENLIRSILSEHYEKQSYETEAKSVYELTTDLHGDIEHLYQIELRGKDVTIFHDERPSLRSLPDGEGFPDLHGWINKGPELKMKDFRALCNREIRATNRRVSELRKKNPRAYAAMSDQDEIKEPESVA